MAWVSGELWCGGWRGSVHFVILPDGGAEFLLDVAETGGVVSLSCLRYTDVKEGRGEYKRAGFAEVGTRQSGISWKKGMDTKWDSRKR